MSHLKTGSVVSRRAGQGLLLALSLLTFTGRAFAQTPSDPDAVPPAPAPAGLAAARDPAPAPPQNARATELWQDMPLGQLKASISLNLPEPEQLSPAEVARLSQAAPLLAASGSIFSPLGDSRPWMLAPYEWEAPATRHLPLLFEEPNLERLGYTCACRTHWWDEDGSWWSEEGSLHAGKCLQPFISAAHFFGRVPLVPYLYGVDCPCEPIYTLGVDRPGSPVPYRRHNIPLSLRGALYQAGATVGLLSIIP